MSTGTYLGDADLLNRPAPFMAADNFQRLTAIRDAYDPQLRFPGFRVEPGAIPNEFEGPDEFEGPNEFEAPG